MKNDPVNNMPYVRHMLSKFCRFRSHSNTCVHFCRMSGIIILYPFQASKLCVCYLGIQILWYFQNYWDGMECPVYHFVPFLCGLTESLVPLLKKICSLEVASKLLFQRPMSEIQQVFGFCFYVSMCFFMPIFFFLLPGTDHYEHAFPRQRCCSEEVLRQNASSQKEVSVLPVLPYFGEVCI